MLSGTPDLLTAGFFLWTWIEPLRFHHQTVAGLMLVMLLEFILIHSAPFLGGIMFDTEMKKGLRIMTLLGISSLYFLFVGGFALAFESWWPVIIFVWLLGAKIANILLDHNVSDTEKQRQQAMWVVSTAYYLLAVFATVILPVPEFGITHHGHYYGIPGSGEWVSHPNVVVAAGVLYFGLLAITRIAGWDYKFSTIAEHT